MPRLRAKSRSPSRVGVNKNVNAPLGRAQTGATGTSRNRSDETKAGGGARGSSPQRAGHGELPARASDVARKDSLRLPGRANPPMRGAGGDGSASHRSRPVSGLSAASCGSSGNEYSSRQGDLSALRDRSTIDADEVSIRSGVSAGNIASLKRRGRKLKESGLELTQEQTKRVRAAFLKYDVDQSGKIDKGEFVLAMRSLRFETATKAEEDMLFRTVDINGDGEVDYDEFLTMITAKIGSRVVPGISVNLEKVLNLVPGKSKAITDPLAVLSVGKYSTYTTKPRKKTFNPVFNEVAFLPCPDPCHAKLRIKLFGSSKIFRLDGRLEREYLGGIEMDISDVGIEPKDYKMELKRDEDEEGVVHTADFREIHLPQPKTKLDVHKSISRDLSNVSAAGRSRKLKPTESRTQVSTQKAAKQAGKRVHTENDRSKSGPATAQHTSVQAPEADGGDQTSMTHGENSAKTSQILRNGGQSKVDVMPKSERGHKAANARKSTGFRRPGDVKKVSRPERSNGGGNSKRAPAKSPRNSAPNRIRRGSIKGRRTDDSEYGTIYFQVKRATEHHRRDEGGEENRIGEWSDSEEIVDDDLAAFAKLEENLRYLLTPEGQKDAAALWDTMDTDGLGLVALHRVCDLIKDKYEIIYSKPACVAAYTQVLLKQSDSRLSREVVSASVDRRSWVEAKHFVRLLCNTFFFKRFLDLYDNRYRGRGIIDPDLLVELREFQFMMKRVGIKSNDAEVKAWYSACESNDKGLVRLDDLSYFITLRRFFPDDEIDVTLAANDRLTHAEKVKAKRQKFLNKQKAREEMKGDESERRLKKGSRAKPSSSRMVGVFRASGLAAEALSEFQKS